MMSVTDRLNDINRHVMETLSSLEKDPHFSDQLSAVMKELYEKSRKAISTIDGISEKDSRVREIVVELEQAADSAKAVAASEKQLADFNKQKIIETHDEISSLKKEV